MGLESEYSTQSAELAAIVSALETLSGMKYRRIVLITRSKAGICALRRPRQQSGQEHIRKAYQAIRTLKRDGNSVTLLWIPKKEENELLKSAKERAKAASRPGATPENHSQPVQ